MFKIKKGDKVIVLCGDHKGSIGVVSRVILKDEKRKAILKGINVRKKHVKPTSDKPQGGIVEKESPIDMSNLAILDSDNVATRVGFKFENNEKCRVSKKSGRIIKDAKIER